MKNHKKNGISTALTIAGSDCSGGAGIQADLKTFAAHGVYGMSVVTALTAQNTQGVSGVFDCSSDFLNLQIDAIFDDIFPDAVKIGMVSSSALIDAVVSGIKKWQPRNLVIDPVMVSTSGHRLLNPDAEGDLLKKLIPMADLITPNIYEAEILSGIKINTADDMVAAAVKISESFSGTVLVKGGHSLDNADDCLYHLNEEIWLRGERVDNPNTHGTGCTLSSAIAANLALGHDMVTSVKNAKSYITNALKANLNLGKGRGPLDHLHSLKFR